MRNSPARQNFLPLSSAMILLIGAVLILGGVVLNFVKNPHLGEQIFPLYEILMGGGAVCLLLGAWLSWQWSQGKRSHSDQRG